MYEFEAFSRVIQNRIFTHNQVTFANNFYFSKRVSYSDSSHRAYRNKRHQQHFDDNDNLFFFFDNYFENNRKHKNKHLKHWCQHFWQQFCFNYRLKLDDIMFFDSQKVKVHTFIKHYHQIVVIKNKKQSILLTLFWYLKKNALEWYITRSNTIHDVMNRF